MKNKSRKHCALGTTTNEIGTSLLLHFYKQDKKGRANHVKPLALLAFERNAER